jgi:hypothetical protein
MQFRRTVHQYVEIGGLRFANPPYGLRLLYPRGEPSFVEPIVRSHSVYGSAFRALMVDVGGFPPNTPPPR